jgi:hypothetical protein
MIKMTPLLHHSWIGIILDANKFESNEIIFEYPERTANHEGIETI